MCLLSLFLFFFLILFAFSSLSTFLNLVSLLFLFFFIIFASLFSNDKRKGLFYFFFYVNRQGNLPATVFILKFLHMISGCLLVAIFVFFILLSLDFILFFIFFYIICKICFIAPASKWFNYLKADQIKAANPFIHDRSSFTARPFQSKYLPNGENHHKLMETAIIETIITAKSDC